jgi:selenocysteine lyase/cysteine desulfurase
LESGVAEIIPYSEDGSRFAGATYDPSGLYRLDAVLGWLETEEVKVSDIHAHAMALEERFLAGGGPPGELLPPPSSPRGNFLTFRSEAAGATYEALHGRRVTTDHRGDRLRIGFGVYQDETDVDRLLEVLAGL